MALKIGIQSYVSGGFTNPVIWRLYETGTGVFVDDHQEAGPHGQVYQWDWVNNIKDIVYTVIMYEQPGGTGVGTLIKSHDITVSTSTLTIDADIELIVNGTEDYDPVAGENSVIIPQLLGKDFYVMQRGVGQLLATRQIEVIPDTVNGGFSLTGDYTFNADDIFVVKIRPQYVINPAGTESGSKIYTEVVLITADTTLTTSDFGKLLIVDGSLPVLTLQLPAIDTIIEKVPLHIECVGSTNNNVVIKAALGENIKATGVNSNTFILGRATRAQLIKLTATGLYGFTDDQDIKRVGQIEWAYYVGVNRLWADGTEFLIADFPRLKKAMDAMPAGSVVTYLVWNSGFNVQDSAGVINDIVNPYKGFYAISPDGLSFKVPDLRNRFIRGLANSTGSADVERMTNGAGGFQWQSIRQHNHSINTTDSNNSGAAGADPVRGSITGSVNTRGGFGAGKTIGQYGLTETRPVNIGMIPLIIY